MTECLKVTIHIPDDVTFASLKLQRDSVTGDLTFDDAPIRRICEASGIEFSRFCAYEDNLGSLLSEWYKQHLLSGGARDPVQEDLLEEMHCEDARDQRLSYPPGRA